MNDEFALIVMGYTGRRFGVRVVRWGDRYGRDDCLTYGDRDYDREHDPMIEFYDLTYANQRGFGPRGQFVSRYFRSTLFDHQGGLCLYGGEREDWSVPADAVLQVVRMLWTIEPTPEEV